jgi:hypothetical protein
MKIERIKIITTTANSKSANRVKETKKGNGTAFELRRRRPR